MTHVQCSRMVVDNLCLCSMHSRFTCIRGREYQLRFTAECIDMYYKCFVSVLVRKLNVYR